MDKLQLKGLTKAFGGLVVVDDLNLTLRAGEFVSLLGPSGCGKTTTLRMIAGFVTPTAGTVEMDGRQMSSATSSLPPEKRRMSMIFQSYALWPNMTVEQNVAFGLELRKLPREETRRRVAQMLEVVHMGHLAARYPAELSGGQQQRVALARAIVIQPQVLLLDEPLSNLDANLREEMRFEIRRLHDEFRITTVYVTHDQSEAMTLGHRVAVLKDGLLQQCEAPRGLYERPANTFVAGFIGSPSMNLLRVPLGSNGAVSLGGVAVTLPDAVRSACAAGGWKELVVGVRPESLELAADGIAAEVQVVEEVGADAFLFCSTELGGEETRLVARATAKRAPARGERVTLRPVAGEAHLFDPVSGSRLG
jgi:ABC-type sugar transport system ATPase subunit